MQVESVREAGGMKRAQCESCGAVWEISEQRDISRGYLCPDCEDRIMMRPKRSKTNVWRSEER